LKNKTLILLIAVIIIIALVIGIVFFLLLSQKGNEQLQEEPKNEDYDIRNSVVFEVGTEPIIANLNTVDEGKKAIIRVRVFLRLADEEIFNEFTETSASPQITDLIIGILRAKTPEEMSNPDSIYLLKEEIISLISEKFQTDKVLDLYFEEFIIQ
jgi:flagellar FliL protein